MGYPKKMYKSLTERMRVRDEAEEQQAKADGWLDVGAILQNGQFVDLKKPEPPIPDTLVDKIEENKAKEQELEVKIEDLQKDAKLLETNIDPMDVYIEETGGRPMRNGKPTRAFLKWKEKNGYS